MPTDASHTLDDEFSVEDLEKLQPIFTFGFIITQILIWVGLIWCGWAGFAWYFVIPIGSIAWFGNKFLKRLFRNQFETLLPAARKAEAIAEAVDTRPFDTNAEDIAADAATKQSLHTDATDEDTENATALSSSSTFFLILIGCVLPAVLWYGIGVGLHKLFN